MSQKTTRTIITPGDISLSMIRVPESKYNKNGNRIEEFGPDTPLFNASEKGNVEVVRMRLEAGAQVDATNYKGATPLYIASREGHVAVVHALLERGAAVDAVNNNNVTPLLIASGEGHLKVVHELLYWGAAVDARNNTNVTPLLAAAARGHLNVVKALIEADADVNAANTNGTTPLLIASQEGHSEIVEELLSKLVIPEGEEAKSIKEMLEKCKRISVRRGHPIIKGIIDRYLKEHVPRSCMGALCSMQGGTRRRRKVIRKSRERKSRKSMR